MSRRARLVVQGIPDVDFNAISELFGQDANALKVGYSTGYE